MGLLRYLGPAGSRRPRQHPSNPADLTGAVDSLLRQPSVQGLTLREAVSTAGMPLSSFTNRLTPLLAGPRVLANLSIDGISPAIDAYLDVTARASRVLGRRLRKEDEDSGRRGRNRRSTAWPVGDDESKSLIRYRRCFMFMPDKKDGFAGPLLKFGFVAISGGEVYLTEAGARFASAMSPAIDQPGQVDLLSRDHQNILSEAIIRMPGEVLEIKEFLDAMERASGSQDEVDKNLGVAHPGWSEAQVVSHRAAMVGRLETWPLLTSSWIQAP